MNRLVFFLLLVMAAPIQADPGSRVFTDSTCWPFYASLTRPFAIEGRTLEAGLRGVVIRMEDPARVIIDFGRDGIAAVPVGGTDFIGRAEAIRAGTAAKEFPNYILHVGPRLVTVTDGRLGNYDFKLLTGRRWFLTIYTVGEADQLASIAAVLEAAGPGLQERGVFVLLMPLAVKDDRDFGRMLGDHGIGAPFLYSHLAPLYARTFQHDLGRLPLFVLNDADGKVYGTAPAGADDVNSLLRELPEPARDPVAGQ